MIPAAMHQALRNDANTSLHTVRQCLRDVRGQLHRIESVADTIRAMEPLYNAIDALVCHGVQRGLVEAVERHVGNPDACFEILDEYIDQLVENRTDPTPTPGKNQASQLAMTYTVTRVDYWLGETIKLLQDICEKHIDEGEAVAKMLHEAYDRPTVGAEQDDTRGLVDDVDPRHRD